eukprot:scaffold50419_cov40-Prasinocladus_malaysianus.AAC.1
MGFEYNGHARGVQRLLEGLATSQSQKSYKDRHNCNLRNVVFRHYSFNGDERVDMPMAEKEYPCQTKHGESVSTQQCVPSDRQQMLLARGLRCGNDGGAVGLFGLP